MTRLAALSLVFVVVAAGCGAGPTAPDRAAGLTTNIPVGTTLRGVSVADGTATVDLSRSFESEGPTPATGVTAR